MVEKAVAAVGVVALESYPCTYLPIIGIDFSTNKLLTEIPDVCYNSHKFWFHSQYSSVDCMINFSLKLPGKGKAGNSIHPSGLEAQGS